MIPFSVEVMTPEGATSTRVIKARSKDDALSLLRKQGLYPLSIGELEDQDPGRPRASLLRTSFELPFGRGRALIRFSYKLSTLLRAGIVLLEALKLLQQHDDTRAIRGSLQRLEATVAGGAPLSEGLETMPSLFPPFYLHAVRAGEEGGELVEVLQRLASQLEASAKRKARLVSALVYPFFVISASIGVLAVLQLMVIPRFKALFASLRFELPELTLTVLAFSEACQAHAGKAVIAIAAALFGHTLLRTLSLYRLVTDRLLLAVPVIGKIVLKENLSWFFRSFAMLIGSGIALPRALELCAAGSRNFLLRREIERARLALLNGDMLSRSLRGSPFMPQEAIGMTEVGERTGTLDEMLEYVAGSLEEDLEVIYERFQALFEPILILALTGIVGVIVVALYLPILSLIDQLGTKF
jgi:type IV pilus assembly protein PilC